jgi:hypothetical protein
MRVIMLIINLSDEKKSIYIFTRMSTINSRFTTLFFSNIDIDIDRLIKFIELVDYTFINFHSFHTIMHAHILRINSNLSKQTNHKFSSTFTLHTLVSRLSLTTFHKPPSLSLLLCTCVFVCICLLCAVDVSKKLIHFFLFALFLSFSRLPIFMLIYAYA